jgi:hypothetical protein
MRSGTMQISDMGHGGGIIFYKAPFGFTVLASPCKHFSVSERNY